MGWAAADACGPPSAAMRSEQLLQPLIAQHQLRLGLDHQTDFLVRHAPGKAAADTWD